jgi:DNA-binding FrmR family transcriptional regulator
MTNDVILNKISAIERCIKRINEEIVEKHLDDFREYVKQVLAQESKES